MSFGGGSGSSDTRFSRQGTTVGKSFRDLTSDQRNQLNQAVDGNEPVNRDNADGFLSGLLKQTPNDLQYNKSDFSSLMDGFQSGRDYVGKSGLESVANIDVQNTDYQQEGYDKYIDNLKQAVSAISVDPNITHGGNMAEGFLTSDAVQRATLEQDGLARANKAQDFGLQSQATSQLQGGEYQDAAFNTGVQSNFNNTVQGQESLQNQAANSVNNQQSMFNQFLPQAYDLLSTMTTEQTDDLTGRGSQNSQSSQWGASCCFIFLEAYHGVMPEHVRECRDEMAPESSARRKGYRKMASWLVPLMQESDEVRELVWQSMIVPLTRAGGYLKKVAGYEDGFKYLPAIDFWFNTWEKIGNVNTDSSDSSKE